MKYWYYMSSIILNLFIYDIIFNTVFFIIKQLDLHRLHDTIKYMKL